MPRVTTVKKAQKSPGVCGACAVNIEVGDSYRWWKFRYGAKRVRCAKSECTPKSSDLTQSAFYGALYGIQETVESALSTLGAGGNLGECISELSGAAEELRSLGEECRESLDNMSEGLQQGDTGQLLETRADECESKADELEAAASDLENVELVEADSWEEFATNEGIEREESETDETFELRVKEKIDEHNEQLIEDAVSNVDVDLSID